MQLRRERSKHSQSAPKGLVTCAIYLRAEKTYGGPGSVVIQGPKAILAEWPCDQCDIYRGLVFDKSSRVVEEEDRDKLVVVPSDDVAPFKAKFSSRLTKGSSLSG